MGVLNQNAVTIQIVDRPDQLAAFNWDSVCQPDHYFTASYLCVLAHAGLDCSFRYFVAQQAGQIVGITFGYLRRFPLIGPLQPLVFISGSPVNLGFPFAFQKESQKEEIFFQLVLAMIEDARKQHVACVLIRDLYAGPLESYYRAFTALPECVAFLLFHGEQLAVFHLAYERGTLFEASDCGVDASLVGKLPAHRYLTYEIISYAMAHNLKAVDFGASNEAKKLRLGCRLQNVHAAIYPLSGFYSILLRFHLERWLLTDFGFKVPPTNADDEATGWVQPAVFKPN